MGFDESLEALIRKYGEDNGRYLYEEMTRYRSQYRKLTFIETGLEAGGKFRRRGGRRSQGERLELRTAAGRPGVAAAPGGGRVGGSRVRDRRARPAHRGQLRHGERCVTGVRHDRQRTHPRETARRADRFAAADAHHHDVRRRPGRRALPRLRARPPRAGRCADRRGGPLRLRLRIGHFRPGARSLGPGRRRGVVRRPAARDCGEPRAAR